MCQQIRLQDIQEALWKNGGGITQELFRIPHPTSPDDFIFRLSIAHIKASGDFSLFPGIDRILMLLKGSGLLLKRSNHQETIINQPLCPIYFKGEEAIKSDILCGPIKDFNIMTHRDWGKAEVNILDFVANTKINFKNDSRKLLYQESGIVTFQAQDFRENTLWILDPLEEIELETKTSSTFINITLVLNI